MSLSGILPPGPVFVINCLPTFILPLVGFRAVFFALDSFDILQSRIPWQIQAACYALSVPSFIASRIIWHTFRKAATAAWLGVAEVPQVQGKLPGNLDIILKWDKVHKELGYAREYTHHRIKS